MADTAYSGALARSAHFASRPPVPGIDPEHEHPDPEADPFQPSWQAPAEAVGGDVWLPEDVSEHTEMQPEAIHHWTALQSPVPSSVPGETAGLATTARMLANHSVVSFRPDVVIPYKVATQGRMIDYRDGRPPWQAGESVPEQTAYLVMGRNAYDQTNEPNEVYSAERSGRYRDGSVITDFGLYEYWTLQGQDALLRAYEPLSPQLPVDKPRVPDSAPYVPNSSGTARWTLDQFRVPSFFGSPSETAVTDYGIANRQPDDVQTEGQFDDGGRL